ncbi:YwqG family protein [Nitratireductor sp. ZSWI3]|uniref:YwqG family protein n=1 Tax=Nitratireductor sp. ZSWI3 TaxID=2966359 RepID=UPI00214FD3BF|nr:YwqG family protein [Nitratireductor sp. ZSWI3]MCR4265410.1 YwqG family protein [Nitratireductor sp. ZSWI3]
MKHGSPSLHRLLLAVLIFVSTEHAMAYDDGIQPLPTDEAGLAARLEEAGLSRKGRAIILAASRPALVLETTPVSDDEVALGASRIGGVPDLPPGMPWPMRDGYENAGELAAVFNADARNLYADAGLPPPWLSPEDGRKLVDERKRLNEEAWASTRALMEEAGVEVDFDPKDIERPGKDEIEAEALLWRARAEAVGKSFPLAFIGQFDLAALSTQAGFDASLPDTGRLLLFYDLWILPPSFDPRSSAGLRLIYDETPVSELVRAEPPEEFRAAADPRQFLLAPAAIAPRSVITTIPAGGASWRALGLGNEDDAGLYHEWLYTLGWPTAESGNHQLGGWPRAIQGGMQSQSQLAANGVYAGTSEAYESAEARRLLEDAQDWRLVLQIGRDDVLGLDLPGAFYVLMRGEDLAERRFDRAWIVYEQD